MQTNIARGSKMISKVHDIVEATWAEHHPMQILMFLPKNLYSDKHLCRISYLTKCILLWGNTNWSAVER